jgi:hypothetical protein
MTNVPDPHTDDIEVFAKFLTPEQVAQLKATLKKKGKVIIKGIPLIPLVSEARIQGDWSCPNMLRKRYGYRRNKRAR